MDVVAPPIIPTGHSLASPGLSRTQSMPIHYGTNDSAYPVSDGVHLTSARSIDIGADLHPTVRALQKRIPGFRTKTSQFLQSLGESIENRRWFDIESETTSEYADALSHEEPPLVNGWHSQESVAIAPVAQPMHEAVAFAAKLRRDIVPSDERMQRYLVAADAFTEPLARGYAIGAFRALMPHMTDAQRNRLFEIAGKFQPLLRDVAFVECTIPKLTEFEPKKRARVLGRLEKLPDASLRGDGVVNVSPDLHQLPPLEQLRVIDVVGSINDDFIRSDTLIRSADGIAKSKPQVHERALDAAAYLRDPERCAATLTALQSIISEAEPADASGSSESSRSKSS